MASDHKAATRRWLNASLGHSGVSAPRGKLETYKTNAETAARSIARSTNTTPRDRISAVNEAVANATAMTSYIVAVDIDPRPPGKARKTS